jgi:zinc protease
MVPFKKYTLDNGLTVIVNEDFSTQIAAVDVLYKVGARNELASKTGFAHLFEHLMFGGSKNAPDFDTELQLAGGTNNAFTTNGE